MTLRLARLNQSQRIVNENGGPTQFFQALWQSNAEAVEAADRLQAEQIAALAVVQAQLAAQVDAIQAAQDAIAAANAAIVIAQTAADNANAAVVVVEAAAASANTAAAAANASVDDIEAGVLNVTGIKVGGQRFVNNAGVLELEP